MTSLRASEPTRAAPPIGATVPCSRRLSDRLCQDRPSWSACLRTGHRHPLVLASGTAHDVNRGESEAPGDGEGAAWERDAECCCAHQSLHFVKAVHLRLSLWVLDAWRTDKVQVQLDVTLVLFLAPLCHRPAQQTVNASAATSMEPHHHIDGSLVPCAVRATYLTGTQPSRIPFLNSGSNGISTRPIKSSLSTKSLSNNST